MKLISNKPLREFALIHPAATEPLQSWRHLIERNTFESYADLKGVFASVDKVGEKYVFNIGGNKYRLVATIAYKSQVMWVKGVMTHSEYDKGAWK